MFLSLELNNKNNRIMETTKFTKAELNAIATRLNAIHAHGSEDISLKDRLVSYYMTTDEKLTKEEAVQTVSRLMAGVDDLTSKYKAALENGWNPSEHITEMTASMTTQERYDFLVNAISIVKNLNVNILGDISDINGGVDAVITELKTTNTEVTDATCWSLQASLVELLESSPLMLTGEDKIKEMMDAARGQSTNVVDFASSEYDDYRYKNEMALAAWIEHKEGNITSLPEGILPESLGVSIAAGVEEAQVMAEVASGNKTFEWAVKCLKVLGGIALVCFLGYIALWGIFLTASAFFETTIFLLGSSSLAVFIAYSLSFLVSMGCCDVMIKFGTKVLNWFGDKYDQLVTYFKELFKPQNKAEKDQSDNDNIIANANGQIDAEYYKDRSNVLKRLMSSKPAEATIKDYLVNQLTEEYPNISNTGAANIIEQIQNGVDTFYSSFAKAITADSAINISDIESALEDKSTEEKCNILCGIIAFVQISNNTEQYKDITFKEYQENLYCGEEPSEKLVTKLIDICRKEFENYSLPEANIDLEHITGFIGDQRVDELYLELFKRRDTAYFLGYLMYIEKLNDGSEEINPFIVGLGAAASVKQIEIISEASYNRRSKTKLKELLKMVISVAIFALVVYFASSGLWLPAIDMIIEIFMLPGIGLLYNILSGFCMTVFIATAILVTLAWGVTAAVAAYYLIEAIIDWIESKFGKHSNNNVPSNPSLSQNVIDSHRGLIYFDEDIQLA